MKSFDFADTHKGLGTPRAHTLRTTGLAGSPLQDPHRSPSLVLLWGPYFLSSVCPTRHRIHFQPPAALPADPGCCLLAVPAASLGLQTLQLLGRPGVFQGGPARPPSELGERVCGGVPCRGQRMGRSRGLHGQKDPLGRGQKALVTPTLGPE